MLLTIKGNTPSQKNRKIISVNRGTGKPFLRSHPKVKEWQEEAQWQLREQFHGYQITNYPVAVIVTIFYGNKRRHDLDNGLASVMDALVASQVLEDDDTDHVSHITVQSGYDKENPRAEVELDD